VRHDLGKNLKKQDGNKVEEENQSPVKRSAHASAAPATAAA
jgi:hypothetical protein